MCISVIGILHSEAQRKIHSNVVPGVGGGKKNTKVLFISIVNRHQVI